MLPLINGSQAFIIGIVKAKNGFQLYGTFDHRVTAGRRFADFLNELRNRIKLYFNFECLNTNHSLICFFCTKTIEEEKSTGNRGLISINDGNGNKLICRSCFDGW
jgi:hypothetical protein